MRTSNLLKQTVSRKILFCWLLGVLAAVGWPRAALATTYYVDYLAGLDANSGTTASAAWKHCPGDLNAAGVSSNASLMPGDTVLFNTTNAYILGNNSCIFLKWSGTIGSPITYSTYGTGKCALDGTNNVVTSLPYAFYEAVARSNLTFNNFEIRNLQVEPASWAACTNNPNYNQPVGISLTYGAHFVTISNCYFHDIGSWTNAPNYNEEWMLGAGIYLESSFDNITITSSEWTHIAWEGIYLVGGYGGTAGVVTNVLLTNLFMHDFVRWGLGVGCESSGTTMQGIIVDGLVQSNYWQYSPNEWQGCPGYFPHTDGMDWIMGWPLTGIVLGTPQHPNIVRNCTFINNATNQNDIAGTANCYFDPWGGTLLIYNNVGINVMNFGEGCFFLSQDITPAADYHIFNNTFFDTNHVAVWVYGMTNPASLVDVRNNIFYNYSSVATGTTPITIDALSSQNIVYSLDYNVHYNLAPSVGVAALANTFGVTFSGLTNAGYEAHGQYINPQFAHVASPYPFLQNSSLNDVRLTSTSPARFAGANLSAYFSTDKAGNPRPTTFGWDIGAYQFVVPPLTAPTGLHVVQ